jgi:hypothetical protein
MKLILTISIALTASQWVCSESLASSYASTLPDTIRVVGLRIPLAMPSPRTECTPEHGNRRSIGEDIICCTWGVLARHDPSFLNRDSRLVGRLHIGRMQLFDSSGREFSSDPDPERGGAFTPRYAQGSGGALLLHWWHP